VESGSRSNQELVLCTRINRGRTVHEKCVVQPNWAFHAEKINTVQEGEFFLSEEEEKKVVQKEGRLLRIPDMFRCKEGIKRQVGERNVAAWVCVRVSITKKLVELCFERS